MKRLGRPARIYEHNGERGTLAEFAERLGLERRACGRRLRRGWSLSDALTLPKYPYYYATPPISSNGTPKEIYVGECELCAAHSVRWKPGEPPLKDDKIACKECRRS